MNAIEQLKANNEILQKAKEALRETNNYELILEIIDQQLSNDCSIHFIEFNEKFFAKKA